MPVLGWFPLYVASLRTCSTYNDCIAEEAQKKLGVKGTRLDFFFFFLRWSVYLCFWDRFWTFSSSRFELPSSMFFLGLFAVPEVL